MIVHVSTYEFFHSLWLMLLFLIKFSIHFHRIEFRHESPCVSIIVLTTSDLACPLFFVTSSSTNASVHVLPFFGNLSSWICTISPVLITLTLFPFVRWNSNDDVRNCFFQRWQKVSCMFLYSCVCFEISGFPLQIFVVSWKSVLVRFIPSDSTSGNVQYFSLFL